MRLKNENFRNMPINLRSGTQVRADQDGCIEVENENDAAIMQSAGWKAIAARSPRVLPGSVTASAPAGDGPLWPGGPTKKQVEEMRAFAEEAHDALHDAKNDIQVRDAKIAKLEAEIASLKAAQAPASGPQGAETGSAPSEPAEGASEAEKPASAPRRPKAPKPE